ncbi:bifunctional hydroxymethylpyrimidine kinase/phosphomethylpyrimidine kinase, partial [Acidaminococcus fermentans]|uniref:bifunctional hydroxymethylpyrimidine kinase/phosphomethylpyrimidine kinase n=1 Tax=Acidaminococcus fermentans TaxID=905 RepID=UPI00242EF11F
SIQAIRQLAFQADLLTPNLTEFCILTDTEMDSLKKLGQEDPEELYRLLKYRSYLFKDQTLVITGIPIKGPDRQLLVNLVIDHKKRPMAIPSPRLEGSYSGTGDLFAAVLMGSQLQKRNLEQGVRLAGELIVRGIADAQKEQTPWNDGINYEPYLGLLSPSSFHPLG